MRENPNDNLDFLNYVIGRVCYELKINGEKIFDIVPHSGRIRPKKFDKYINIDTIPIIFGDEYYKVNEVYSDLHHVLSKQREEREKERYKDDYYFFKL
jgi:hypothetical protein